MWTLAGFEEPQSSVLSRGQVASTGSDSKSLTPVTSDPLQMQLEFCNSMTRRKVPSCDPGDSKDTKVTHRIRSDGARKEST